APTAGLHFTRALLDRLERAGIGLADVLLHIGPGTFAPIRSESLEDHRIHEETYAVGEATAEAVRAARRAGRRVVAVGTSALRALESAAGGGDVRAASGTTDLF